MRTLYLGVGICLSLLCGCQRVPSSRYGVKRVRVLGTEQMDEDALKNCLQTQERDRFRLTLGVSGAGDCGEPPFDGRRKHLNFFPWPWTRWPLYDGLAMEKDRDRIKRWYEARGFHGAQVVAVEVAPEQARQDDTLAERGPVGCERLGRRQGCSVKVEFKVREGEPTLIESLSLEGHEALPEKVREELAEAVSLKLGGRFDEAAYDTTREALLEALGRHGYAKAKVQGEARVDRDQHEARVRLQLEPGPRCVFGNVEVIGTEPYLEDAVRGISLVQAGDPFSTDVVLDVRQAVFGTNMFASVVVEPKPRETGNVVDLLIELTDLPRSRFGIGAGAQAGVVSRGDGWGESISVPQWDVHLIARYTRDRVFDGPRRFKLEERPAMITQEPFPGFDRPRFGNRVSAEFLQMGVLEDRIAMTLDAAYDYGPDYFDTFFRHRVDAGLVFSRYLFLRRVLFLSSGIRYSAYRVHACPEPADGVTPSMDAGGFRDCELTSDGKLPPANYQLPYSVHRLRVDFRDDPLRPTQGALLSVELQQSLRFRFSSWGFTRITPDLRLYAPLFASMSLAARFALGMYFIRRADENLDQLSQDLGPREGRLRGGGASSNRGFLAGQLGDGDEGGTRRWEASLELRVPIMPSVGLAGFVDAGDVSRRPRFRFDHPQMSSGFGVRVYTPLGAVRLDVAWQLPGLQVIGDDDADQRTGEAEIHTFPLGRPGAFHFSLGEAF